MGKEEIDAAGPTEHEERRKVLSPWEQHASVISLPRFDYRTPSLLLESSHSGFLITCPIKREKSATKEVISILEKFSSHFMEPDSGLSVKRRKIEEDRESGIEEATSSIGLILEDNETPNSQTNEALSNLSLVKLTRSGLILLIFPSGNPNSTVHRVLSIFRSLECGDLKPPLWCHRIFPIQETCTLKEKELSVAVTSLCRNYLSMEGSKLEKPIKFAVGYNRRGLEQSKEATMLDRDQCFAVVAKAIKDLAPDAIVDLNLPQITVLVEALPVSGLPCGSAVAGISILPSSLIAAKPRLSVKALIAESNNPKKKKS